MSTTTKQLTIEAVDITPSDTSKHIHKAEIYALMSDGSEKFLFSYYDDELEFRPGDFYGLTVDEALRLFAERDIEYLQS